MSPGLERDGRPLAGAAASQGRGVRGPAAALAASLDGTRQSAGYPRGHTTEKRPSVVDRVDLETVLAHYGVLATLRRRGTRLVGRCPVHGGRHDRQFVVTGNRWYCFGRCRSGGGILDFTAAMEGVGIEEAARILAAAFPRLTQRTFPMATKPTHKVLAVTERPDGETTKSYYTKIGVAFPVKKGAGLSLVLDALPLNGRLVVLEMTDDNGVDHGDAKDKA